MNRWARIPEALILDGEVSHAAVRVWARMERYQGSGDACYASRAAIAADLGMSESMVKRALRELISTGWVSRVRRGRVGWEAVVNSEPVRPTSEPCDGPPAGRATAHIRAVTEPMTAHQWAEGGSPVGRGGVTSGPCKEGAPTKEPQLRSQERAAPPPRPTDVALIDVEPIAKAPQITAATLVGRWIDHCNARPPGNVIGQVGKHLAAMLAEGIDPAAVEAGLAAWHAKGLHPATLPSVVNEVALNPPSPLASNRRRLSPGDQALALIAEYRQEEAL